MIKNNLQLHGSVLGIKDYEYFRTERLNNQYSFNPFDKN